MRGNEYVFLIVVFACLISIFLLISFVTSNFTYVAASILSVLLGTSSILFKTIQIKNSNKKSL